MSPWFVIIVSWTRTSLKTRQTHDRLCFAPLCSHKSSMIIFQPRSRIWVICFYLMCKLKTLKLLAKSVNLHTQLRPISFNVTKWSSIAFSDLSKNGLKIWTKNMYVGAKAVHRNQILDRKEDKALTSWSLLLGWTRGRPRRNFLSWARFCIRRSFPTQKKHGISSMSRR